MTHLEKYLQELKKSVDYADLAQLEMVLKGYQPLMSGNGLLLRDLAKKLSKDEIALVAPLTKEHKCLVGRLGNEYTNVSTETILTSEAANGYVSKKLNELYG